MRRAPALLAVAIAGALVGTAGRSSAAPTEDGPGCGLVRVLDVVSGETVTRIICGGHIEGIGDGGGGGGTGDDDRIVYPLVRTEPGGLQCVYLARVTFITGWDYDPPDAVLAAYLAAGVPWCPGFAPIIPAAWVQDWWRARVLPRPIPAIQPGEMLVGLDAYLEAHMPVGLSWLDPATPFGALTVDATCSIVVEWGDGSATGPFDSAGSPWPSGAVTHAYERSGAYRVVVTATWSATWTLGGQRGSLPPVTTTGTIDDFPVRAVQAVGR